MVDDPQIRAVLRQDLARRDRPTSTHFTLEVAAYWKDDFVDAVRLGLRSRLTVGGLRSTGRANLAVELEPPLVPYTIARVRGPKAYIRYPSSATAAVRRGDGRIEEPGGVRAVSGLPFDAREYVLSLHWSFAFRIGTLVFLSRFVHRDGSARHAWDWLLRPFLKEAG